MAATALAFAEAEKPPDIALFQICETGLMPERRKSSESHFQGKGERRRARVEVVKHTTAAGIECAASQVGEVARDLINSGRGVGASSTQPILDDAASVSVCIKFKYGSVHSDCTYKEEGDSQSCKAMAPVRDRFRAGEVVASTIHSTPTFPLVYFPLYLS